MNPLAKCASSVKQNYYILVSSFSIAKFSFNDRLNLGILRFCAPMLCSADILNPANLLLPVKIFYKLGEEFVDPGLLTPQIPDPAFRS